jgi:hypothetical protein
LYSSAEKPPPNLNRGQQPEIETAIQAALSNCLDKTWLEKEIPALLSKKEGKVKKIYSQQDHCMQQRQLGIRPQSESAHPCQNILEK